MHIILIRILKCFLKYHVTLITEEIIAAKNVALPSQ